MQSINRQYNPAVGSPAIEQRKPYPANQEEAQRFSNNLMEALHSKEMHQQIMQTLQSARQRPAVVIGQLAAQIVMAVLIQLRKKTGRPPHLKMALHGLKMVIQELSNMAAAAGIARIDPAAQQQAGKIAGDMVEQSVKDYGSQQETQQQGMGQQPGIPQGGVMGTGQPQPGVQQVPAQQGGGYLG